MIHTHSHVPVTATVRPTSTMHGKWLVKYELITSQGGQLVVIRLHNIIQSISLLRKICISITHEAFRHCVVYTTLHAHTHMHTPTCTHPHAHTRMHTPTCTHPHAHTRMHTPTCKHMCMSAPNKRFIHFFFFHFGIA